MYAVNFPYGPQRESTERRPPFSSVEYRNRKVFGNLYVSADE